MKNICVFGDSIAYGSWDDEMGGWVNRLKAFYWTKGYDVHMYNFSVCGERTKELLRRVEVELKAVGPDQVLFAIGINDSQVYRLEDDDAIEELVFEKNLYKLIGTASAFTDEIVLLGLTNIGAPKVMNFSQERIDQYDMIVEKVSKAEDLMYIKLNGILQKKDFCDDLVHPNSTGHKEIFQLVKSEIKIA